MARRRRRYCSWQELPSGAVIHLQGERPPTLDALKALDEIVRAVHLMFLRDVLLKVVALKAMAT